MNTKEGLHDFIDSRDFFGNTALHYVALFDEEDIIITVLEQMGKSSDFAKKV